MLPSLLAREIQNGLKHFLTTGFEPSDHLFSGVMKRFTADESSWMKTKFQPLVKATHIPRFFCCMYALRKMIAYFFIRNLSVITARSITLAFDGG